MADDDTATGTEVFAVCWATIVGVAVVVLAITVVSTIREFSGFVQKIDEMNDRLDNVVFTLKGIEIDLKRIEDIQARKRGG